jgi:hypothetical protein
MTQNQPILLAANRPFLIIRNTALGSMPKNAATSLVVNQPSIAAGSGELFIRVFNHRPP